MHALCCLFVFSQAAVCLEAQVPVFELGTDVKPAEIARQGLAKARAEDFDAIIVDTAGRLQVLPL